MKVEKRAIRQRIEASRKNQSPLKIAAAGAAIAAGVRALPCYRTATALISYIARGGEVPTDQFFRDANEARRPVYLPVVGDPGGFARWNVGDPLVRGEAGIPEPGVATTPLPSLPTVALVPLVACTPAGVRLGRGGGFYDRVFSNKHAGLTLVGLAFEYQVMADLPDDPWDVRLDYVVTERRVMWCGDRDALDRQSYPQEGARKLDGVSMDLDWRSGAWSGSRDAARDVPTLPDATTVGERRGDGATDSWRSTGRR